MSSSAFIYVLYRRPRRNSSIAFCMDEFLAENDFDALKVGRALARRRSSIFIKVVPLRTCSGACVRYRFSEYGIYN